MPTKNIRNKRSPTVHAARPEGTNLDGRYGRIGISAVAAAARYCGQPEERKAQASSSGNKREKVKAEVAES